MKYESVAAMAADEPQVAMATRLEQVMIVLLAVFVLTLPLVEAPKNIVAGVYLVVWCARAALTRDLGGRWSMVDTAFALMLGSAIVSGLAGYAGDVSGVVRVYLLSWCVSRSGLAERSARPLRVAACVGLLVAIPFGLVPFLLGHKQFLELPSVGQVNQSALYIAILTAAAFGWWLQGGQSGIRGRTRITMGLCATVFCGALLVGASRAAIVACAAAVVVVVYAVRRASHQVAGHHASRPHVMRKALLIIAALALLVAGLVAWKPELSDRKLTLDRVASTFSTWHRMQHWRIAYEGWRERPVLGWGPDSFQQIKVDDICAWKTRRGETCERELYTSTKHAHSLYMATLVERGLLGVLALAVFLGVWGWTLARSATSAAHSLLWVGSAAGLVVVVVGGVFNTTLRVEHGSLALLWFGLWVAAQRAAAADPQP